LSLTSSSSLLANGPIRTAGEQQHGGKANGSGRDRRSPARLRPYNPPSASLLRCACLRIVLALLLLPPAPSLRVLNGRKMAGAGGVSLRRRPAVAGAARSEARCTGRAREFGCLDLLFLFVSSFEPFFRFWCRIPLPPPCQTVPSDHRFWSACIFGCFAAVLQAGVEMAVVMIELGI
jgi:hypothetical protein